jgi:hypothetical protein
VEYASPVWDPYLQKDKYKIEMVQRRAARYVTNRYHNKSSVSDMLENLKWQTLEERRTNARLTMLYKIKKNIEEDHKLIPTNRKLRNTNSNCFQIPSCNTTTRKESFYPRTIRDWNTLPNSVTTASSLKSFKRLLATK